MVILTRLTRFGGFPALQIGRLSVVRFSKRKFGLRRPKAVQTKKGLCDLTALNIGRLLFIWEQPCTV